MAALNRPTTANYEVHENVRVDTQDNEDHTFCGVLFPIKIKEDLPVSQLVLYSVAVRGRLGPMTVWISNEDAPVGTPPPTVTAGVVPQAPPPNDPRAHHFRLHKRYWTKVYEKYHAPSIRHYQTLDFFDHPVILKPGTVRAIYIHSSLPGDEAIVYDNTRHQNRHGGGAGGGHWGPRAVPPRANERAPPRYEDNFVSIYTGKAHLSTTPFGQTNIWGWDNAWRDYREFVGQLQYGTVFQLWQPTLHPKFGSQFDHCTQTLLALQRRVESPVSMLPDECIFYILNMCRWDWFDDTGGQLKQQRRKQKALARAREQAKLEMQRKLEEIERRNEIMAAAAAAAAVPPAKGCCMGEGPPDVSATSKSTCGGGGRPTESGRQSSSSSCEDDAQFFDTHEELQGDDDANDNNDAVQQQMDQLFGSAEDSDEDADEHMGEHVENESSDSEFEEGEEDEENHDVVDDEEENDEEDDDEEWDRANGYRANPSYLSFRYVSSDEEEEDEEEEDDEEEQEQRHAWFRRHFARIHILQALAQAENEHEDDRAVLMHLD